MNAPFTGSLHIVDTKDGASTACRTCEHVLAAVGQPWKSAAAMKEQPMNGTGGGAYVSAPHVVLRQFYCPGCGALLDTETAMSDDPFLNDVINY